MSKMKDHMIKLSMLSNQEYCVQLTCSEEDLDAAKVALTEVAEEWDAVWLPVGISASVVDDVKANDGIHLIYEDGVLDDA